MMIVLSPTYTVRITFKDVAASQLGVQGGVNALGHTVAPKSYKFSDEANGKTGCDEFVAAIKDALQKAGLGNADVRFEKYEQRG